MLYALDSPPYGLGLRRLYRQNHSKNEASSRSAERLGFVFEGTRRFGRVVPAGKVGNGVAVEKLTGKLESCDIYGWAICCDEWKEKRKGVVLAIERESEKDEGVEKAEHKL